MAHFDLSTVKEFFNDEAQGLGGVNNCFFENLESGKILKTGIIPSYLEKVGDCISTIAIAPIPSPFE